MTTTAVKFETNYMDRALFNLEEVVETACEHLGPIDFDTIVGTGFSGGVVIPYLALTMGKKFMLIRKEDDNSHHGGGRVLGQLGKRWIFVDDLISSGNTRDRVLKKVQELRHPGYWVNPELEIETEFVGQYLYSKALPAFEPAAESYAGFNFTTF